MQHPTRTGQWTCVFAGETPARVIIPLAQTQSQLAHATWHPCHVVPWYIY